MSYQDTKLAISKWAAAARPKTLPAAAAPVIVGTALAYSAGKFNGLAALACLVAALLLQIGSNLANDVFDYEKGADAGERFGPTRVTQAGLLTPSQVKRGMALIFGVTILIGVYLIIEAGWPILILGVAAILSAIAYTGGPFPLGYHGRGDLFVFIFFGLAATAGTFYVQAGEITLPVWAMSTAMGFLIVNILVVNNLRDLASDRLAGKMTLAVRLGEQGSVWEYALLLAAAYILPLLLSVFRLMPVWGLLCWVSLPIGYQWLRFIQVQRGRALNRALAGSGQLALLYGVLYAVGLVVASL